MDTSIPPWLAEARAAWCGGDDIFRAPDGTYCVWTDYGDTPPVFGIPSEDLAKRIVGAMWEMEKAGAYNAMCD